jgi:tRNA (mo5U34)-methyltransferase
MFKYFEKIKNDSNESFFCEIEKLSKVEFAKKNGNKPKWEQCLKDLANVEKSTLIQKQEYLFVDKEVQKQAFENLRPWRKGPYSFKNFNLDSEWNGFIKWQRIEKHLNFTNKTVLDVGCGNGYFAFLMGLKNAKFVLGLEPFLLFNYQFKAIQSLTNNTQNIAIAPLKLEQIPDCKAFDIVFSMGVLYHAKSPIEHILKLKQMLTTGGELVLETLIVEGTCGYSLTPTDRYAKMRNVWFIPSEKTLISWLKRCGFASVEVIDDSITSFEEQRKTSWIGDDSQSLEDFVEGEKTIEGYPRPRRLMLLCRVS